MITNILILDVETSGLHPEKGAIVIEVGVVLYNLKHKTVLQAFSTLFPCKENPVEDINGIKPEATQVEMGYQYWTTQFLAMIKYSQAIVAHNAQFDKKFIMSLDVIKPDTLPWICTKTDFKWPVILPRKRLMDVCEFMGVEYANAHRSLADCMLLVECFNKIEDLQERFENALGIAK